LLDDRERAQLLGMNGRRRIEERFSAGVMASAMADVYRTLVANEAGAGALAVRAGAAS
jgi:glycosyltransferase involved in cell wall biosynthesis